MEFPIKLLTIKPGWSIVYISGSQLTIIKHIVNLSLNTCIGVVQATGADPDEMPHNVAFHLGLHCLPKYLFLG